ncbi:hypothetical protein C7377_1386 [Balneicella halophila]|uniref:Phospholipase n=1 Tax=Balneicella halophila TaxID=1537566 RepID=A0A7L4UPI2_BALHA|nr:hypothetical protein [Balneicella halophila]PVX51053.1 hypothetical protein C7377_1386 [Balneicella halophila]
MLIIISALIILGIIIAIYSYFSPNSGEDEAIIIPDEECCGAHEICEVDLKKLSEEIIYFEDEELDAFKGTPDDSYSDEAIEQFREVLYTLKPKEISDWLHSLELRKIEIPDILKPEVRMLLAG